MWTDSWPDTRLLESYDNTRLSAFIGEKQTNKKPARGVFMKVSMLPTLKVAKKHFENVNIVSEQQYLPRPSLCYKMPLWQMK